MLPKSKLLLCRISDMTFTDGVGGGGLGGLQVCSVFMSNNPGCLVHVCVGLCVYCSWGPPEI